eukprot:9763630-Alexandrium_andersonii.AAC.1
MNDLAMEARHLKAAIMKDLEEAEADEAAKKEPTRSLKWAQALRFRSSRPKPHSVAAQDLDAAEMHLPMSNPYVARCCCCMASARPLPCAIPQEKEEEEKKKEAPGEIVEAGLDDPPAAVNAEAGGAVGEVGEGGVAPTAKDGEEKDRRGAIID